MERTIKREIKKAYKSSNGRLDLYFLISLKVRLLLLLERRPNLAPKALDVLDYAWFEYVHGRKGSFSVLSSYDRTKKEV